MVVCVSRLVRRKGQDTLIRAWPRVRAEVSDAVLLLVGDGPYGRRLRRLAAGSASATPSGSPGRSRGPNCPGYYDAADVFAMPCRTRRAGLDVEGLGIVYLEASATGLPVIGGDSGGAPDAILEGESGYVVGDVAGAGRPPRRAAHRSGQGPRHGGEGPGLGGPRMALGTGRRPPGRDLGRLRAPGRLPRLSRDA